MSLLDISEAVDLHVEQHNQSFIDHDLQQNLLVDCLKKVRKSRSDCERIYEEIKNLDFFKNLFASYESENNNDILLALSAGMKYESARMGSFVFHQGDDSNEKFYVILNGQVGIVTKRDFTSYPRRSTRFSKSFAYTIQVIKDEDLEEEESDSAKFENGTLKRRNTLRFGESFGTTVTKTMAVRKVAVRARQMLQTKSQVQSFASLDDDADKDQDFKEMIERYGNLVRILSPGNDFGDAVFKKPGQKRTASVVCKTDCEFLIISAGAYTSFIASIREKRRKFLLGAFSFLSSIHSSHIEHRFIYSFFSQCFNEGEKVTDEGQENPNPKLFLIEHGTCKIQRKFNVEIKNPLQRYSKGPHTNPLAYPLRCRARHVTRRRNLIAGVTSNKILALSINKQAFIKLHPDIEKAMLKFYRTKQAQRDETFARLSQELLAQEEAKREAFLQKHGDMVQMVNRKALTVFAGRENRAAVIRKMSNGTPSSISSLQFAQTEASDSSMQEISNIGSANLRPSSGTLHSPKLRFSTEASESLPCTAGAPRKQSSNWFENKVVNQNLQKIEELSCSSPVKQKTSRPISPNLEFMIRTSIVSDHSLSLNLQNRISTEQNFYHGNHFSPNVRSPTLVIENHKELSIQNFSESVHGKASNSLIDRARIQELLKSQKSLVISSRHLNDSRNTLQLVNNETLSSPNTPNDKVNNSQRILRPKTKVIRMRTPTLEHESVFQSFRTTKNDLLRSTYLENFKLSETPNASDIDKLRFEFDLKKEAKLQRGIFIRTRAKMGKLSDTVATQNNSQSRKKSNLTDQSRSPIQNETRATIKVFQQKEHKFSQSPSSSYILAPQRLESMRNRLIHSRPTFKQYFLDLNSSTAPDIRVSKSTKCCEEFHSVASAPTEPLKRRWSIIGMIPNAPNQRSLSVTNQQAITKNNLQEQNIDPKSRILGAFLSHRNSFSKRLVQRGYNYHNALQKRSSNSNNSMDAKNFAKNENV